MCGIALCCTSTDVPPGVEDAVWHNIQRRGPNHFERYNIEDTAGEEGKEGSAVSAVMGGAVLHIQGDALAVQPMHDAAGGCLLWNGEIFWAPGNGVSREQKQEIPAESDTYVVSAMLSQALSDVTNSHDDDESCCIELATKAAACLAAIEGPYAFIYYHRATHSVVYGRDPFGRRSLVGLKGKEGGYIIISSTTAAPTISSPSQSSSYNLDNVSTNNFSGSVNDNTSFLPHLVWEELSVEGVYAQTLGRRDGNCGVDGARVQVPWPTTRLRLGVCRTAAVPFAENSSLISDSRNSSSSNIGSSSDGMGGALHSRLQQEELASTRFLALMTDVLRHRVGVVHDVNDTPLSVSSAASSIAEHAMKVSSMQEQKHQEEESIAGKGSKTSPIGVLFSGGIDSVFLTAVLHNCLPPHHAIDLINVSFDGPATRMGYVSSDIGDPSGGDKTSSPDRLAAIAAYGELKVLFPSRLWRLVHVDVAPVEREEYEKRVIGLIQPQTTHMDLNIGTAFWFASRGQGYTREYSAAELGGGYEVEHDGRPLLRRGGEGYAKGRGEKNPPLPLLHKGVGTSVTSSSFDPSGTATTIIHDIAALSDSPSAALSGRTDSTSTGGEKLERIVCSNAECAQISKPGCLHDLCKRCCVKRFKIANAALHAQPAADHTSTLPQCPVHKQKNKNAKSNANPTNVEAPLSNITVAIDKLLAAPVAPVLKCPYQSACKVLIVGIGADEQLAGYSRHRSVYERGGLSALVEELHMDTARIYNRNLGRDDRCISDHGREAWFPFLDEKVVQFLQNTPLDLICNLAEPQGEGDKKILRSAAKFLGLQSSTQLVKRAIQFGTRVAKHTNVKYHGSNRSGKGTTQIC